MLTNPKHKAAGQDIFMGSMIGLANVLAIVITFLCTPWLHTKTLPWVQQIIIIQYGNGFQEVVTIIWFCISGCLVFFISRASIATALVMGAATIATRLL